MTQKINKDLRANMEDFHRRLAIQKNFDIICRTTMVADRQACFYFIDGFVKDDIIEKLMEFFYSVTPEDLPKDSESLSRDAMPYVEVELLSDREEIEKNILSGVMCLFIDGFDKCFAIDCRTYPMRSVQEPEKDKVLRGSKDGFVETIVFNTALIRRRIRSTQLRMEMLQAGKTSHTDIVLCYMEDRVDQQFLEKIRNRIQNLQVDALTLNQESLAECLYQGRWWNPFPKFRFSERPDTAAAQVLEGNIIILVDNSPSALITPTSLFDVLEEADDYYFPPITGTYLRLSRLLIAIVTYFLTPTFLLLMEYPQWIPKGFEFIAVRDTVYIPLTAFIAGACN